MRARSLVAALADVVVLGGTATAVAVASPATSAPEVTSPVDPTTPATADMLQLHEQMLSQHPEMGQMHERMTAHNPDMQGTHEQMMGGS